MVGDYTRRRKLHGSVQEYFGAVVPTKAGIAQAEGDLPRAAALLAPLHPGADNTLALEIQVYQAILERHSASIIPRLKDILAPSCSSYSDLVISSPTSN